MQFVRELRGINPIKDTSIELAKLVFFDIETTGLRPDRGAKISEVAIVNRNSQLYTWHRKINNEFETLFQELPMMFNHFKKSVVIGHNLSFDFWFISYEADKLGLEGPSLLFIDTLSLARKILPERNSYKLDELLKVFDIKVNGELHTAITDAEATRALFWKLVEKGGISTVGDAGMKKLNWLSF